MTDSRFQIDGSLVHNSEAIEHRVSEVPETDRDVFQLALRYLYVADGPTSIPRDKKAAAEKHLTEEEKFVFQWLYKRTDGKLRRLYGSKVLDAVKKSRYQCAECGFADIRALHLEKAEFDEESKTQHFVCVCANCNTIAARKKEMATVKTNKQQVAEKAAETAANAIAEQPTADETTE